MSTDSHGHSHETASGSGSVPGSENDPAPIAGARRRRQPEGPSKAPPRRRRKARRVHRVVHHLDIWSLAKIGSIYVACGFVITMISGFILWRAADLAGTIDGIEGFMEDTGGYDTFVMRGEVVFSSALLICAVLSVLAVCMIILAGILFNLISDLTGGIRLTVIDEDLLVTPARRGATPRSTDGREATGVYPTYEPEPEPEAADYEDELGSAAEGPGVDETRSQPNAYEPVAQPDPLDSEPESSPVQYAPTPESEPDPAPVQPEPAPASYEPEPAAVPYTPPPFFASTPDPETEPGPSFRSDPSFDPDPFGLVSADVPDHSTSENASEPVSDERPLFDESEPETDDDDVHGDEPSEPPKSRFEIDFG